MGLDIINMLTQIQIGKIDRERIPKTSSDYWYN